MSDENSNYLPDLFPNHHLCPPNVEVIPSSQTVGKMLVIYFKYNEPWKFETTYQLNDNDYSYQSPMITYSNGQVFFTHLIAPFCKQNLGL